MSQRQDKRKAEREEFQSKEWYEQLDHLHRLGTALLDKIEEMEGWEQVWEYEYKLFGVIPIGKRIQKKKWRPKRD